MEKEGYYIAASLDKIEDDIRIPYAKQPRFLNELNETNQTIMKQGIRRRKTSLKKAVRFAIPKELELRSRLSELDEIVLPKAKVLGKMIENKLHGYCEVTYMDSSVFKGEYNQGCKVSGTFKFFDGTMYIGEFANESFHGEGKFIFPNGKFVEGTWNQGKIEGNAKIIYNNGDVYFGETLDLKKHGKGTLYFLNDTRFVGEFEYGNIQGMGTFYQGQTPIQTGCWEKGRFVGEKQI